MKSSLPLDLETKRFTCLRGTVAAKASKIHKISQYWSQDSNWSRQCDEPTPCLPDTSTAYLLQSVEMCVYIDIVICIIDSGRSEGDKTKVSC